MNTTKTPSARALKIRATKAANARYDLVNIANAQEQRAFNMAIQNGAIVVITTFQGTFQVDNIDSEFWIHAHTYGQPLGYLNTVSYAYCNDGAWADLLRQAGVTRDPIFRN